MHFLKKWALKFTLCIACVGSQDQLTADEDLSMEQRLALAGGSALEGVGKVTDNDALGFAGMYCAISA